MKEHNQPLVFRHTSPYKLSVLHPLTYMDLAKSRGEDMPKPELVNYMKTRLNTEVEYHKLLPDHPKNHSFLYATIVGFHKMEPASAYPGFTYYFTMNSSQIENCLFEVIDVEHSYPATHGLSGLELTKRHWERFKHQMKPTPDEWFGTIDPRVEVVIPFSVKPFGFVPQEEDR